MSGDRQEHNCPQQEFCVYRFNKIDETLKQISEKVDRIHTEIFVTNGHPSLLERMRNVEGRIAEHTNEKKRSRGHTIAIWGAIGTALLAVVAPKIWIAIKAIVAAIIAAL